MAMIDAMKERIGSRRSIARLKLWRYRARKASLHVASGGVTDEFSSAKWRHVVL